MNIHFSKNIAAMLLCLLYALNGFCGDKPVKPITGTWINLAYQDVRNKYTNPTVSDNTGPELWEQKVQELHEMGMEYLVFMAVANEGRAYYPSLLMPHVYPEGRKSPVDAIMDAAARFGMKVFMSTGWAKDQDDNLRDPAIRRRQQEMMQELAGLYGHHPALYGWYLPVEDCLCPLLSEHAVTAVNALTDKARSLTPGKKILISPLRAGGLRLHQSGIRTPPLTPEGRHHRLPGRGGLRARTLPHAPPERELEETARHPQPSEHRLLGQLRNLHLGESDERPHLCPHPRRLSTVIVTTGSRFCGRCGVHHLLHVLRHYREARFSLSIGTALLVGHRLPQLHGLAERWPLLEAAGSFSSWDIG